MINILGSYVNYNMLQGHSTQIGEDIYELEVL